MHNGTEKRSATALRVRNPQKDGSNIAPRISQRVGEARKRMGAWRQALGRQIHQRPGRSVVLAVGVGYLLGGGLFSRLTARALGTGMRIGLRLLVPFVTQSILTEHLQLNKKETQP